MRTKSEDPQWSHSSGALTCEGCALPLLAGTRICPFCERLIAGGPIARALDSGRRLLRTVPSTRRVLGVPEPIALAIGICLFGAIALASAVAAFAS